jgi:hypothetical protein
MIVLARDLLMLNPGTIRHEIGLTTTTLEHQQTTK